MPQKSVIIYDKDSGKHFYNLKCRHFGNIMKITCCDRLIFNPDKISLKSPFSMVADAEGEQSEIDNGNETSNELGNEHQKTTYDTESPSRADSIKRAKDKAFEIAYANDFQYFVTLTLDKEKIDRYDPVLIYKKLKDWLSNRVRRNGMQYLIFPEYHKLKEGETEPAIHFHGLILGSFSLNDSGKRTKAGQTIYNLSDDWKFGFSTCIELDDQKERICFYIMKYITKGNQKILGKFYLAGGKGLERSVPANYFDVDFDQFPGEQYDLPFRMAFKYATLCKDLLEPDLFPTETGELPEVHPQLAQFAPLLNLPTSVDDVSNGLENAACAPITILTGEAQAAFEKSMEWKQLTLYDEIALHGEIDYLEVM